MSRAARRRLDPAILNLPVEKMREGYYSDVYFNRAREILEKDGYHPRVRMQVFQRAQAVLCGIDEAVAILKLCSGRHGARGSWEDGWAQLDVRALYDGDAIEPFETVMTIEGDYALFAHLETEYLGVLARRTRIATNARAIVGAAGGKDVLFFPARFDHHLVQTGDGYAAYISGALGVSTDANAEWWGSRGMGTVPHALIAAYGGDTVRATRKFAQYIDPSVNVISLVDFDNDCVGTSLAVARALGDRLWGVRLDTSGTLVDASVIPQMGTFVPTGVNAQLVHNVRNALDAEGFRQVRIVVSGGFDAERIRRFERDNVPVDAYAVGSAFFTGTGAFDFTADIVAIDPGTGWQECHKVGRPERPNPRLTAVV
ncbi:MAG: quinolinate phosphoribosyl transferase [Candidatus Eremiobacteraeota bacterium]|nr:quinolinate phosphoribosyl transferase [Candidatus Eremiobacteraeota bacterium]MBV8643740.1 quinolinate phosphoribosyl transferase [Candidatus Eremiobacteraeota bacterium]